MKLRKALNFFLGIPLTILSFAFIVKIFLDNSEAITNSFLKTNLLLFGVGILFFTLFFWLKSIIWLKILENRGHNPQRIHTLYTYSLSEVKRYIPGSIFAVVGRVRSHSELLSKGETLKGIGIEALLLAGSSLFVSIPALLFLSSRNGLNTVAATALVFVAILITGIILLNPRVRKIINSYADYFFIFCLAWLFYGIGCLFVTASLGSINLDASITIASLFVVSWLVGYLFFIAPMGLGARELAVTFLLSTLVPIPIASAAAVLSRIAMTIGEMLYLLTLRLLLSRRKYLHLVNPYYLIIGLLAATYSIYFSVFTILRHEAYLSGRFDLGNMTQTVWNTANGRFFTLTNPDGVENVSRLAVHSDFILVLFAPFYFLWSNPGVLLVGQSIILAIGGFFVFALAKEILRRNSIALVLTVSYYLNFWLQEQNVFDFHAVSLSTTFLLASMYFLIKKRYVFLGISLLLAVLTKENIFLISMFFGFFIAFKEKKYIPGGLLAALSLLSFYLISFVAIPASRGGEHFALEAYSYLKSPNPQIIFNQLLNYSTFYYFHSHLISTGYLALLSPAYLLFTLPEAAIYLLSTNFEYRSYEYHFGAAIIPFVYVSTIYGIKFITQKFPKITLRMVGYYLIAVSAITLYFYSPLIGMKNSATNQHTNNYSKQLNDYLNLIPPEAKVSATNELGAHLSHREWIYVVPYGMDRADFIAIYNNEYFRGLVDVEKYESVIEDENIKFHLFKKKLKLSCSTCTP